MKRIPTSTYRLQMHKGFTLSHLKDALNSIHSLGVSDLYLSPLLAAVPGSAHGYDLVDFERLNPEIGTEEEFAQLSDDLNKRQMGLVLDFVPNHMCISSPLNRWWWDLLEKGRDSSFDPYFDIDWEAGDGKVLLPFLGEPFEQAKKEGKLHIEEQNGQRVLRYFDCIYPYPEGEIPYRLMDWKEGLEKLNYRRFFNISSLAGVRMEAERVFEHAHRKLFCWIEEGKATGLRLDHIDGLYDPGGYCRRLKQRFPELYVTVEKILEEEEEIPQDWDVDGETGYAFLNLVNGIFVEPKGRERLEGIYCAFTGHRESYDAVCRAAKKQLLQEEMRPEMKRLIKLFSPLLEGYSTDEVKLALEALIVAFPVYRTYLPDEGGGLYRRVVDAARMQTDHVSEELWEALLDLFSNERSEEGVHAIRVFQQTTGPIMAKGVEDTALYRYFPLASLNEVGGDPSSTGALPADFHQKNRRRLKSSPYTLLATTTHDTKRSEDVRMRLHVLSEIPEKWEGRLNRWSEMNSGLEKPDPRDEYLFYQTVMGSWPGTADDTYVERISAYMLKAVREAKRQTSWINPNARYEQIVQAFVRQALAGEFAEDAAAFVSTELAPAGFRNSLSQLVLKIASPGVPDFYQGAEGWLLTLVDPDNRGVVDFSPLHNLPEQMPERVESAEMKGWFTRRLLEFRNSRRKVFLEGEYREIETEDDRVIAFEREGPDGHCIAVTGRFFARGDSFENKLLPLSSGRYRDVLTGKILETDHGKLEVEKILDRLPATILEAI